MKRSAPLLENSYLNRIRSNHKEIKIAKVDQGDILLLVDTNVLADAGHFQLE